MPRASPGPHPRVDWKSLTDAYGDAAGIPGLVRRACSPDHRKRKAARAELAHRLCHQGLLSDASAATIPLLSERLGRKGTPNKAGLVGLIVLLAVGTPEVYLGGRDIRELSRPSAAMKALWTAPYVTVLRRCYVAGKRACEVGGGMLTSKLAAERVASAYLLTFYPSSSAAFGGAVRARLRDEPSPLARAALLLCLGYWARWRGSGRDADRLRAGLHDSIPIVRGAAAIGLAACGQRDPEVARELVTAMNLPADGRLPWMDGRLGELATTMLADGSVGSTSAIADSLARHDLDDDTRSARAAVLARSVFPSSRSGRVQTITQDMPLLSELTEAQRLAMEALARLSEAAFDRARVDSVLRRYGVPGRYLDVRRYLGPSPAGPMDRLVTGRIAGESVEWPAHRWVRRAALGSIARQDAIEALSHHPSCEELIAVLLEGAGAYDLSITQDFGWPVATRLAIDVLVRRGAQARAVLEQHLDADREPGAENSYPTWILVGALARLALADASALPARYDDLVSRMRHSRIHMPDVLETVTMAVPEPRRSLLGG